MQTEVLIIGGGLAGCATAYYLASAGVEVMVVERYDLNTQASGCNAGSIHAQIPHEPFMTEGEEWARTFAPTIPIMLESIRLWAGLEAELGTDLEVSLGGGILVAETEAQLRDVERKVQIERAHGLGVELLSRGDLRQMAPYVSERMIGGAYCATEKLTLKQARNGSLLIGGGWPARRSAVGGRPIVDLGSLRANLKVAQQVVPAVGAARLLRVWPAIVNGTKDWKPILGEVPGLPGFFMNMFPWMGFTAGPISARVTAELVMGRPPSLDLQQFSALRHVA